jgi:hypothetical protein
MKVRFDGNYCICECGNSMMYLETIQQAPRRRIVCANAKCQHFEKVFLEPVFQVELAEGFQFRADFQRAQS